MYIFNNPNPINKLTSDCVVRAYSERYSGDDMMKLKDELGRLEGSMDGRAKRMIQDWMQDLN